MQVSGCKHLWGTLDIIAIRFLWLMEHSTYYFSYLFACSLSPANSLRTRIKLYLSLCSWQSVHAEWKPHSQGREAQNKMKGSWHWASASRVNSGPVVGSFDPKASASFASSLAAISHHSHQQPMNLKCNIFARAK